MSLSGDNHQYTWKRREGQGLSLGQDPDRVQEKEAAEEKGVAEEADKEETYKTTD